MIMKARKKQVIMDFLHDDMKKLDYHVSKIFDNLYVEHQRYHKENFNKIIDKVFLYYLDRNDSDEEVRDFYLKLKEKQNIEEVERLISYWRTTTKNLNK